MRPVQKTRGDGQYVELFSGRQNKVKSSLKHFLLFKQYQDEKKQEGMAAVIRGFDAVRPDHDAAAQGVSGKDHLP